MIRSTCKLLFLTLMLTLTLTQSPDDYWHIRYIQNILEVGLQISYNQTWADAWQESVHRTNQMQPLDIEYPCGAHISRPPSTSVHTLHPADINVVAALGDFVSTGRGVRVKTVFEIINKQRPGEAFSSGGDGSLTTGVLTLPNILKMFNPSVLGYSTGYAYQDSRSSGFNVADVYGTASTLLDQAEQLVTRIKSDGRVDFEKDWKLVTVLIGHNDLCRSCLNEDNYSDAEFIRHVTDTIDYLQRHLPRAFVNLVPAFDYSFIPSLFPDNPLCETFQSLTCPCTVSEEQRTGMKNLQKQYYNRLHQLAYSGAYDNTHNFTVVLQPHLANFDVLGSSLSEEVRQAMFGPDCFHPGRQGQQALASMLWNTMLTRVGQKPVSYPLEETLRLKCPTWTRPYIFTNVNSGWAQLPPGELQPTEPERGEVTSQERLEKVFLLVLVGVAGTLVGIVILGIFIPIIRRKRKPAPVEQEAEQETEQEKFLMQYPRVRELIQAADGASMQSKQLRSTPSGASLVRTGSELSFDNSRYFRNARSVSQTSEDNSDNECKKFGSFAAV